MTGKELYEQNHEFYCYWIGANIQRPWEALPSPEKERWEELAFETEIKDRREVA